MTDRPWLKTSDDDLRGERALLEALQSRTPSAEARERGWTALTAALPELDNSSASNLLDGANAGTELASAGAATSGSIAAKVTLTLALALGAVAGTYVLSTRDSSVTEAPAAIPAASDTPAPRAVGLAPPAQPPAPEPAHEPEPAPLAGPEPARLTASSALPAAQERASTLAQESALLADARAKLRSGSAGEALRLLQQSQQRFPRAVLHEEREVVTIEALAASGDRASARARAQRFLDRHPDSAHAEKVRGFSQ
jgi:type IV secretory pathway VirB10-like protein